ncbi:MAG: gamma-glutamyltransferase [Bacteroidetes bacterium]|nr:gamma-glutamyltransferase [Bacteroidota bacterium]MCL5026549.1 gamma-glutamyltransferase [Chloroflexota bacterium]
MSGPHGIDHEAYRPVVMGCNGMVCSGHPLASQAGIRLLQQGGNAVDAAIAVAAALNVVEPQSSGIGGDGFIMVYWRATNQVQVVNATGAAPFAAAREAYLPDGIPMRGIRSVSTPGLVDGWLEAHARYGSASLASALDPAIGLAHDGFPISHKLAAAMAAEPTLRQYPSSRSIFTRDGTPLAAGEVLRQRDLARSFQAIAAEGRGAFYDGALMRAMVRTSEAYGGLLAERDFRQCRARWAEPITTTYRGHVVYEAPPNSSGHTLLQELNIVEQFDLPSLGYLTPEAIHVMVEAKRMALADREAYMADPDWVDVPLTGLLSKDYARERASLIDPERYAQQVREGDPWRYEGRPRPLGSARRAAVPGEDTTCFVVVDGVGNAVCQLQSIQSVFGSGLVAEGTGILLNNRMTYWHLDEGHPNCLQPGKRVRHTMNPVMVFREGRLFLVCGTPGADTQVQTNLQVLSHVIDFGLTVTEAVEAPRWRHLGSPTESTIPHICEDALQLERRFSPAIVEGLRRRGYPLKMLGQWEASGSEMMIQVDAVGGALFGAADPRRDGYAVGW